MDLVNNTVSQWLNTPQTKITADGFIVWPITLISRKVIVIENLIILLIGVFGNVMSIVVSLRKRFRNQSTFRWLAALALVDLLVNFCDPFYKILNNAIDNFELYYVTPSLCKTRQYFRSMGIQISAWLLVFISVERLLCVIFPMKISLFAMRFANFGIPITYLIFIFFNIYNLFAFDYWNGTCQGSREYIDLFRARNMLHSVIYSYIPLSLLAILNSAIIYKLYDESNEFIVKKDDMAAKQRARRQKSASVMLVTIAIAFIVLTTPTAVVSVIYREAQLNKEFIKTEGFAILDFMFFGVATTFSSLNNSINFYLYCASGESFRDEVCRVLRCEQGVTTMSYVSNANELKKAKKKKEMSHCADDQV